MPPLGVCHATVEEAIVEQVPSLSMLAAVRRRAAWTPEGHELRVDCRAGDPCIRDVGCAERSQYAVEVEHEEADIADARYDRQARAIRRFLVESGPSIAPARYRHDREPLRLERSRRPSQLRRRIGGR